MKCNGKTMIAAVAAVAAALAVAYVVWPPIRALALGIGPYFLLLLCPLSMWLMMTSMAAHDDQASAMTEESAKQKTDPAHNKGNRTEGKCDARSDGNEMRGRA